MQKTTLKRLQEGKRLNNISVKINPAIFITVKANAKFLSAKNLFILLFSGLFLTGLNGCKTQAEDGSPEAIRNQISHYQKEINDLTLKIGELEKQLVAMGEPVNNRAQVPVTILKVEPSQFDQFFVASATVEAVQTATISPEASGQIRSISVSKGQRVSAGQVVARLNTSVIENNISEVNTSLQLARTVFERQKGLWEQQIGSEMQYLEAKNNVEALEGRLQTLQSQLNMSLMRAPFNGIVDEILMKEGELAMPGVRVMNIINLEKLFINADLSEAYLGLVKQGEMVTLRFPAFPNEEFTLAVNRVGNVINPENRTFRVQLLLNNPTERFKPNMMANLSIPTLTTSDALVVPSILIKQDVQGFFLYTVVENNGNLMANKTYIERGPDGEGLTMIRDGLAPGDRVIMNGNNQVSDGSLIRIMESAAPMVQNQ
jgi:membrane fusion protein, multidrug efflux system